MGTVRGRAHLSFQSWDAGEPPVAITLGNAAVRVAGDFYEVAAADQVTRRFS